MAKRPSWILFGLTVVLLSTSVPLARADEAGIIEKVTDMVSGWWNEKPSHQESFEAAARTAEETQEAHRRKMQYGEDTWWGTFAEKSVRAWHYWHAYAQNVQKYAEVYILRHLPQQVSDWIAPSRTMQQRVSDAVSGAGEAVTGVAKAAHQQAAGAFDSANAAVDGGLDAVSEKAQAAGQAAADAAADVRESISRSSEL
jgi:hypothetical protein